MPKLANVSAEIAALTAVNNEVASCPSLLIYPKFKSVIISFKYKRLSTLQFNVVVPTKY
jgi:hypothetical protein